MKTLSIIIPVFNEEKRLNTTFTQLLGRWIPAGVKLQSVIFVNDGSEDSTLSLLKREKRRLQSQLHCTVVILTYTQNRGKGYAIRKGMQESHSDYSLLCDADMSTPLSEIKKCAALMKKNSPVIIGTRKNGHSTVTIHQPYFREKMGKVFTFIAQVSLGTSVTDFTCGFKLFSENAREAIFSRALINRWGYDAELLFLATRLDFAISEVALSWAHDAGTKVHILRDALSSLSELAQIRLNALAGMYRLSDSSVSARMITDIS